MSNRDIMQELIATALHSSCGEGDVNCGAWDMHRESADDVLKILEEQGFTIVRGKDVTGIVLPINADLQWNEQPSGKHRL